MHRRLFLFHLGLIAALFAASTRINDAAAHDDDDDDDDDEQGET